MSEQRQAQHGKQATTDSRPDGGARRWRLALSLLTFLAAVALTYGWGLLTGQNGLVTGPSFALRSTLSVLLVFLGVFVLLGLWSRPEERATPPPVATVTPAATPDTSATPIVPVLTPATTATPMPPLAASEAKTGVTVAPTEFAPTAESQPPAPIHGPVPAANLPRILFDTDEMPAITSLMLNQAEREKQQHAKPLPPPYPDTPNE